MMWTIFAYLAYNWDLILLIGKIVAYVLLGEIVFLLLHRLVLYPLAVWYLIERKKNPHYYDDY